MGCFWMALEQQLKKLGNGQNHKGELPETFTRENRVRLSTQLIKINNQFLCLFIVLLITARRHQISNRSLARRFSDRPKVLIVT